MWMHFGCGTSFLPETLEARQDFFCGSPRVLVNLETVEKLYFIFFAEPRRCSGRRVACEDIEGLQPTRLPLRLRGSADYLTHQRSEALLFLVTTLLPFC
jgi:hypothetical protein